MSGTVNRVILIGRLGKDPEIKYTPSGVAMAKFSLATDESRTDTEGNRQDHTEWHNIVVWKKQAEIAGEYLKKGSLVYLEGRISTRSWDDKESGQKKYMTEIVADRFTMLGPRPGAGEGGGNWSRGSGEAGRSSGAAPQAVASDTIDRSMGDDDLPF